MAVRERDRERAREVAVAENRAREFRSAFVHLADGKRQRQLRRNHRQVRRELRVIQLVGLENFAATIDADKIANAPRARARRQHHGLRAHKESADVERIGETKFRERRDDAVQVREAHRLAPHAIGEIHRTAICHAPHERRGQPAKRLIGRGHLREREVRQWRQRKRHARRLKIIRLAEFELRVARVRHDDDKIILRHRVRRERQRHALAARVALTRGQR